MSKRETPLERDRRHDNDSVAARRRISLRVHEDDASVCLERRGPDDERRRHVGMAPGRIYQSATIRITVLQTPVALLRRRLYVGAGHAVEHEPKRLSADVGVDGSDPTRIIPGPVFV